MKSSRTLVFGLAVALTVVAISTASAQQRGRGGGFGFSPTNLVTVASNEAVQKELGFSADLTGKVNTLREDYVAAVRKEYQTAGIDLQNFQSITPEQRQKMADIGRKLNSEFDPKVKALVKESDYKRLQQIQLQANLRNQGPAALLADDVAAELKLTAEQKQKLTALNAEYSVRRGGGGDREAFAKMREERTAKTLELLTADQKTALEKLKGQEFDVSQLGFGGRRGKN
jgi:Spy/CpxP family protein refolding chaperone